MEDWTWSGEWKVGKVGVFMYVNKVGVCLRVKCVILYANIVFM